MEKTHTRQHAHLRTLWSCSRLTYIISAVGMLMLLAILHSYMKWQVDPRGCAAPMMLPTYIKLLGFDAEQTRFAQKYGLYLYKERGVDEYNEDDLELRGTPVLFLPGNAGSYRQGRSFASEASRFYQDVLQHDQAKLLGGIRRLDFFLADFNEDFAAFDGQTVLDQAEFVNDALAYILSLYQDPRRKRDMSLPDPTSVILIGHSMGGIVARVALTMTNYQFNSVNTIITMSTPHARPPVSFDSDLVATYKQVNDYWRHSYSQKWANNNPLWHVTQISVAGGGGDSVVPSDYTSLASLVPETHGFTVFTSTMPHVWTGVDHLSIAWCDSFRKALIRSLFDIIDVRRATQTKPRAERMSVFRRTFLTGLEDNAERALPRESPNTLLVFEDKQRSVLKQGERLVLRDLGRGKQTRAHLLPVPKDKGAASQFNLLTNQTLDRPGEKGKLEVLFCSNFPLRTGFSTTKLSHELDYSSGSTTAIRLACKNASEDVIHLPSSTHNSRYPFDEQPPFSYLQYGMEDLNDDQFVAIIDKSDNPSPAFLIAEFSEKSESTKTLNFGPLFVTGLSTRLPPFRPMMTEIKIPNLHSSLLAYRLKIRSKPCAEPAELFTPLVRQYVSDPYESKYFVNVKEADINLHGTAPYMPPRLKGNTPAQGLTLQIWSDPSCNASLQVSLKVDLLGSLGKLAMRYRTLFAAFPLVIVALVLRKQFQIYDDTGSFISFAEGMNVTLRGSFPLMILALTLFSTSMSDGAHPSQQMPLNLLGNTTSLPSSIDYEQNDLLLGSQDTFFWFLIPLFGIISVGVCMALNYFVFLVVKALCANKSLWASKRNYIKEMELKVQNITTPLPSRSGIVITIISLFFVVTFIPYQLVFVLACFVQLLTCAQASFNARDIRSHSQYNFCNYVHSVLLLLLLILPINGLVLVVWFHNLSAQWFASPASHHNILFIIPFILLVETHRNGFMIPRITTRLRHVTNYAFCFLAIYTAFYGVTYAYRLHHVVNLVAAWLVSVHIPAMGLSLKKLDQILHNTSDQNERPPSPATSTAGNTVVLAVPGAGCGNNVDSCLCPVPANCENCRGYSRPRGLCKKVP